MKLKICSVNCGVKAELPLLWGWNDVILMWGWKDVILLWGWDDVISIVGWGRDGYLNCGGGMLSLSRMGPFYLYCRCV